jgi:outer membrane immunogenic protein
MKKAIMKTINPIATFVALTVLSTSALFADDANHNEDKKFDGFYVGAQAGIDRMSARVHSDRQNDSGFIFEALIGYRFQFSNNLVVGIEGSVGDRAGSFSHHDLVLKFGKAWSVAASVGISFGVDKDNLIYGKLGVGGLEVDAFAHGSRVDSQNFEGPVSTLGYERSLSDRLSFRTEVSYSSYDPNLDQWQTKLGLSVKF